jgi:hypothetical protein
MGEWVGGNVQRSHVLTIRREVTERDHLVDVCPLTVLGERPPLLAKTFELALETGAIRWVGIIQIPPQNHRFFAQPTHRGEQDGFLIRHVVRGRADRGLLLRKVPDDRQITMLIAHDRIVPPIFSSSIMRHRYDPLWRTAESREAASDP